jgi:Mlc titration factor MtfA (ptsG expression regulator)
MLDGFADGTPPFAGRDQIVEWADICSREFLRLRGLAEQGRDTFLNAYGAKNEAEFFAVATEEFFDRPLALQEDAPDLYRVLSAYYHQDPARRVKRTCHTEIGL